RLQAHRVEHRRERYARPLPDRGPALLACVARDLGPGRELLEVRERERARALDGAADRQAPLRERAVLDAAVVRARLRLLVRGGAGVERARRRKRRDVLEAILARERAVRKERAVHAVREGVARAQDVAAGGRQDLREAPREEHSPDGRRSRDQRAPPRDEAGL